MNRDKFQNDLNKVKLILQAKGLHRNTIHDIMQILSADAVEQANDLKYDRIYTAVALAVRRAYGFGGRKTLKVVQAFDEIMKTVNAEDNTWVDLMAELKDQTGIVIRTGDGDRLIMECGVAEGEEVEEV